MPQAETSLELVVSDVTKQKVRAVEGVSPDLTAAELVEGLIDELNLPTNDNQGRALDYVALLSREARHLRSDERLGDVVESGDWIVLQPNIEAA